MQEFGRKEFAGMEFAGKEFAGMEFAEMEFAGMEFAGMEFAGMEFAGMEFARNRKKIKCEIKDTIPRHYQLLTSTLPIPWPDTKSCTVRLFVTCLFVTSRDQLACQNLG